MAFILFVCFYLILGNKKENQKKKIYILIKYQIFTLIINEVFIKYQRVNHFGISTELGSLIFLIICKNTTMPIYIKLMTSTVLGAIFRVGQSLQILSLIHI
eukprot:TRINITY_DN399_c0_g1_i2.p2 TRINITY_DN399_c0_g1~~TRINITY_DN399_c0_g1_i2.p2  ORF type:complete len:101 (+),score=4.04 TRINITY_DN399_c0_g1_i2:250-552(+)